MVKIQPAQEVVLLTTGWLLSYDINAYFVKICSAKDPSNVCIKVLCTLFDGLIFQMLFIYVSVINTCQMMSYVDFSASKTSETASFEAQQM